MKKMRQSQVANLLILFPPGLQNRQPAERERGLSARDKMDVAGWRESARRAGFDRLVIHERERGDPADFENFLSAYRHGEMWSRFGFVRQGPVVCAWCALTGANLGEFSTIDAAFSCVLLDQCTLDQCTAPCSAKVVPLFAAHGAAARRRMGSAA